MALEIRRIREADEELAAAFARLMPQLSVGLCAPAAEMLRAVVESDRTALFAAQEDGRTVGVLTLAWYDVPSGRKAWIEDVVVDEAMRGRGAGRKLVTAALEYARSVGAVRVALTSNERRRAAHALYEKIGFDKAETTLFVRKI